jgi:hypothetical protein
MGPKYILNRQVESNEMVIRYFCSAIAGVTTEQNRKGQRRTIAVKLNTRVFMLEAIPLDYLFILLTNQILATFIMHVEKDVN